MFRLCLGAGLAIRRSRVQILSLYTFRDLCSVAPSSTPRNFVIGKLVRILAVRILLKASFFPIKNVGMFISLQCSVLSEFPFLLLEFKS